MIYMDNAATTKISKPVADEILNTVEVFGNPSSLHRLGLEAEKKVETAEKKAVAEESAKADANTESAKEENVEKEEE